MDKLRELVGKLHATMRLYSHVGLHKSARQKNSNKIHLQSLLEVGYFECFVALCAGWSWKIWILRITQPFQKQKLTNHEGTSVTFQGDR